MPYLGVFGLEFLKKIVILEISTLKFVKNEYLTHIVNFGIGSAFSKGPGLGPLYKVCRSHCRIWENVSTILSRNFLRFSC